jgi:formylglycine-generating enzyme
MRLNQMTSLAILAVSMSAVGCPSRLNVQCLEDTNCNLSFGGVCTAAPTGNQWCAYPDPECPGGLRFSDVDVGDGVSGVCVGLIVDAGVDGVDGRPPSPKASCIALPHTCGPSGSDDCCNSLEVPGGTFFRSFDTAGDSISVIHSGGKNFPATISTFQLDKYEVTVGRFRAFVAAGQGTQARHPATGAGTHPKIPGSGWEAAWNTSLLPDTTALSAALKCSSIYQTWTDNPGSNENRPINCVTWYEAMAFCSWDGGYLPTEAEWNYAAAGGDEQRAYPWSSPPESLASLDSTHASFYDGTSCVGDSMPGCTLTDLVAVGTKPAGDARWGQSDLTGNVPEWILDYYSDYESICFDCANLVHATNRALRGAGFNSGGGILRAPFRGVYPPEGREYWIGFRCARSAQ